MGKTNINEKDDVICQGWAWKVGNKVKSWKRRYFKLNGSYLTYGKDKKSILKQIPVVSITQVSRKDVKCPKKQFEKFGLLLQLSQRTFKMVPESAEEQSAWIEALTPNKMFFGDLETIMHHSSHASAIIPIVVDQCVKEICKGKLESRGLFRLSGNERRVNFLTKKYDSASIKMVDNEWNVNFVEGEKIHVVASLLKKFLRKLERPLIPHSEYNVLIELFQNFSMEEYANELIPSVKESLKRIPQVNYVCLNVVTYMLHEVEKQNELMKAYNLGVVFGPVFMRQLKINMSEVMTMAQVVQFIIANYSEIMEKDAIYLEQYKELVQTYGEVAEKRREEQTQQCITWLAEAKMIPNIINDLSELVEKDAISNDLFSRIYHAIYWHPKEQTNPISYKELYTIHRAKNLNIDVEGVDEYTDSEFLQSEMLTSFSHDDLTEFQDGEAEIQEELKQAEEEERMEQAEEEEKMEATQVNDDPLPPPQQEEEDIPPPQHDSENEGEYFDEVDDMVIDDEELIIDDQQ